MISVVLKCPPIALKRPRFSKNNDSLVVYDSQSNIKSGVGLMMKASYHGRPIETPCHVKLDFRFFSCENLCLWGIEKPTGKDLDNLVKFFLDAGNGILWKDDRLISSISCEKRYHRENEVIIEMTPIEKTTETNKKIFTTISPNQLKELRKDCLAYIEDFCEDEFYLMNDQEKNWKMMQISNGLIKFSNKWSDKIKKINSISSQ